MEVDILKLNNTIIYSLIIVVTLGLGVAFGYTVNKDDSDLANPEMITNPKLISNSAISETVTEMENMEIVDQATVEIDGYNIQVALNLSESIPQPQAKQMGMQMANLLESKVMGEGNSSIELGQLYDDYSLYVLVENQDELIVEGAKSNVANEITW